MFFKLTKYVPLILPGRPQTPLDSLPQCDGAVKVNENNSRGFIKPLETIGADDRDRTGDLLIVIIHFLSDIFQPHR